VQEGAVSDQCLAAIKPLAISLDEAAIIRALIDKKTENDSTSLSAGNSEIVEKLSSIQQKLNKLTRGYLDEVIDEESYQAAKADLVLEKTRLKQEKERLHRTRTDFWNEPAKEVVNALEMAGKMQVEKSPQEISKLVQKFGTNRLISRKTVSFTFSEPYVFTLSLLGEMRVSVSENASPTSAHPDENPQSSKWCSYVNYLRTFFKDNSST